jgi:tRNA threonylcarbamoyladenosine biosynthesis protein TsaE
MDEVQKVFETHSAEETLALAERCVRALFQKEEVFSARTACTVFALQGDLGAGKTVFTKGIAHALGVTELITSPTFVLQKTYTLPDTTPWKTLVHIDAYRLSGEEELTTLNWSATVTNPYNIVVLEWPENIALALPLHTQWITFEQTGEEDRKITIE